MAAAITTTESQGYGTATAQLDQAARARGAAPVLLGLHGAATAQLAAEHGAATDRETATLAGLRATLAGHEAALANLLNLIGRRDGAYTVFTL